jgi:hypothetical protein
MLSYFEAHSEFNLKIDKLETMTKRTSISTRSTQSKIDFAQNKSKRRTAEQTDESADDKSLIDSHFTENSTRNNVFKSLNSIDEDEEVQSRRKSHSSIDDERVSLDNSNDGVCKSAVDELASPSSSSTKMELAKSPKQYEQLVGKRKRDSEIVRVSDSSNDIVVSAAVIDLT